MASSNDERWIIYALIAALVLYTISNNPAYGNAFQGYSNATGNLLSGIGGNVMGFVPQPAAGCEPNWLALALSFGAGFYANRSLSDKQRREIDSMLP